MGRGTTIRKSLKLINVGIKSRDIKKWIKVFSNTRTRTNVFLSKANATYFTYFTCSSSSRHWKLFFQIRLLELLPTNLPRCSWSLSEICKSVIEIFWNEVFMVRNTVKNWQSRYSTVICTKRSAFDVQFYLMVVSNFLKTWVKDHGDISSRLLERRIWLACIKALLLAVM